MSMSDADRAEVKRLVEAMTEGDDDAVEDAERAIDGLARRVSVVDPSHVDDAKLSVASLPLGTRTVRELGAFSMQFHGYEKLGNQANLTAFGNVARRRFKRSGAVPVTTTGLRAALFMESRRRVHQGGEMTDEDWRYADALLSALSSALAVGGGRRFR